MGFNSGFKGLNVSWNEEQIQSGKRKARKYLKVYVRQRLT